MTKIEGRIEIIDSKDWHGTRLWSFRLEGVNRWFRTGTTQIEAEVGNLISFTDKNNRVDTASVTLLTALTNGAKDEEPLSAPSGTNSNTDIGLRIQWQNARRDASNIIIAALHTDHLPHATNVAKGKRLDLLRGYVKELTEQLIEEENNGTTI